MGRGMRWWSTGLAALAGIYGAAGVGLAAAAAHLAGGTLAATAAEFLLVHAATLVGLCAVARSRGDIALKAAATFIALGVMLFSGELAVHALTGRQPLPIAAPTGGILLILGWLGVAATLPGAVMRRDDRATVAHLQGTDR